MCKFTLSKIKKWKIKDQATVEILWKVFLAVSGTNENLSLSNLPGTTAEKRASSDFADHSCPNFSSLLCDLALAWCVLPLGISRCIGTLLLVAPRRDPRSRAAMSSSHLGLWILARIFLVDWKKDWFYGISSNTRKLCVEISFHPQISRPQYLLRNWSESDTPSKTMHSPCLTPLWEKCTRIRP